MDEFALIDHYFKSFPVRHKDVVYGIGDDAACLRLPKGYDLLVSTDTLVSGVHFLPEWDPYDIACKAVMVNVSDMAAMAAEPRYMTLALTLPDIQESWLEAFAKGLTDSLSRFNIDLIGGDTTRGPLSITLTVMGIAPHNKALKRGGARPGDIILVSGLLGAAALAVKMLHEEKIPAKEKTDLMHKLLHPEPRVDLIDLLREYATSAIDISDGLSADLNHICRASGIGACLNKTAIPIHPLLTQYLGKEDIDLALRGGDDYELCFTVNAARLDELHQKLGELNLQCYAVGVIEERPGLRMKHSDECVHELKPAGYSHF
ncbi:thiamine-phosphate kinase [Legionella worsleiensis]|uniref:Thiamine-monophosphate kinase n=1 Tax=Legionella worsleiensis TaxID=45076 RepID=A0A0W1ALC1_9GAMM|nr:thiamine-phosphate kinase [Legionella worsleiensis]KTD82143.1 thiamine monophosphate kinase (AIR synthase) [Legionella worsleiensis]STY31384.1 thiamine monophosphate kinase (AIR synthase) [Legionella worsleiensis]